MAIDKQAKRSLAKLADYRETFATDQGKRVLWDMMKQFMMTRSFVPGDSYATHFNEGQREVLLHILNKLKTDPKKLLQQIDIGVEHESEWDDD